MPDLYSIGDLIWRRDGLYTQPARVHSLTPSGFRSASYATGGNIKNHRYNARGTVNGVTRFTETDHIRAAVLDEWKRLRLIDVQFDPHTLEVRGCSVKYMAREVTAETIGDLIAELETARGLLERTRDHGGVNG